MNKKILMVTVALLGIAMLTTPVLASPIKGQKVPVTSTSILTYTDPPGTFDMWTTPGGVIQVRERASTYTVTLNILGDSPQTIVGVSDNIFNRIYNQNNQVIITSSDAIWSFPTEGGAFEGKIQYIIMDYIAGPSPSYYTRIHGLLQGTGNFEGQTLEIGFEGMAPIGEWTGYLLKP